jgi:hypothetical protein
MVLSIFKNKAAKAAMAKAKDDYIKAAELSDDSRSARSYKMRIGTRCRAHLDKVFVEGAKKTAAFQDQCASAAAEGKPRPEPPKASPFQTAKTLNGVVYTYVPPEFAEEVFSLGCRYQTMQIDVYKAISLVQEVADKVALDLDLDQPLTTLQFLRDEAEQDSPANDSAVSDTNSDEVLDDHDDNE